MKISSLTYEASFLIVYHVKEMDYYDTVEIWKNFLRATKVYPKIEFNFLA